MGPSSQKSKSELNPIARNTSRNRAGLYKWMSKLDWLSQNQKSETSKSKRKKVETEQIIKTILNQLSRDDVVTLQQFDLEPWSSVLVHIHIIHY